MNTKPQKSFKINLISADTASWTGAGLYNNATYPINMRSIVRDPADYKKKYKMTFAFVSGRHTTAGAGLFNGTILAIDLDFRKGLPIEQHDKSLYTYSGMLNGYQQAKGTAYAATDIYFKSVPKDNQPAYFDNIQDIDNISVSVVNLQGGTIFTGVMNYMIVITFTEITPERIPEIIAKPKKTFKVNLISSDTTSWSGISLYNHATYPINMRSIVRDSADYKKAYKMTFAFKTGESTTASIWNDGLFLIELDFRKGVHIAQYNKSSFTYSGMLNATSYITSTDTYTSGNGYFDTKPTDNQPCYMENIQDIDNITLSVREIQSARYFPPNGSGTLNYMCVVTFTEI